MTEISYYYDEEFIKGQGLSIGNIINPYFSSSPFYKDSPDICYTLATVQPRGSGIIPTELLGKPEHKAIPIDKGLAVIDEIQNTPNGPVLRNKFVVFDSKIVSAPDFYTLFKHRITSSIENFRKSLREVHQMFNWDIRDGFKKKVAADVTETAYVFKASELKELRSEAGDEFKLQNALRDALLADIGI